MLEGQKQAVSVSPNKFTMLVQFMIKGFLLSLELEMLLERVLAEISVTEISHMGLRHQQQYQYMDHGFHLVWNNLLFSVLRLKTKDVIHICPLGRCMYARCFKEIRQINCWISKILYLITQKPFLSIRILKGYSVK